MQEFWDYVIVGNGPAGLYAAEILRRLSSKKILIIAAEPSRSYSRCLLPNLIKGTKSEQDLLLKDNSWYEENSIDLHLGDKVVDVDTKTKAVKTSNGKVINYDKLLIASGADPFVPGIKGVEAERVYVVRTLNDMQILSADLASLSTVVVLGAGFIGLKIAEALAYRGKKAIIVEKLDWVLPTILDEIGAGLVETQLKKNQVDVITGKGLVEIKKEHNKVSGVLLEDGTTLVADAVVVSVGVRPSVDMLANSDVKVDRGIIVNEEMRTSEPDVYAAGDVVVAKDFFTGSQSYSPIWPNATAQARVAAFNMCGFSFRYEGNIGRNAVQIFGLPILSGGITQVKEGMKEQVRLFNAKDQLYQKVTLNARGEIIGFIEIGSFPEYKNHMNLIRKRAQASQESQAVYESGVYTALRG